MEIKTRFSPSPTGNLHIGNIRTAIYAWLFAKNKHGKFLLRIDDTDRKRCNNLSIESILNSMCWMGIIWDEGPYFQTKRFIRYNEIVKKMLSLGKAYKCFCTKSRLDNLKKKQILIGEKPHYDRFCKNKIEKNGQYVVRFCNPTSGTVKFDDIIHGTIEFQNNELDDIIIKRSDGTYTYNFCTAIDDSDMNITHVIRGEDHISNTPKQINILQSLNMNIPKYAHISIVLNNGKKMSKREDTSSIVFYRKNGFLPEAIINYLVRLGWSYKNQEIFSVAEMKNCFDLTSIKKKSFSEFNLKKLLWINHFYIKNLSEKRIVNHVTKFIKYKNIQLDKKIKLNMMINLLKNRSKTLSEMIEKNTYFYKDFDLLENKFSKKYLNDKMILPLEMIFSKFKNMKEWNKDSILSILEKIREKFKLKMKELYMPLRISITGNEHSPEISSILYVIGKSKSLLRIKNALQFIKKYE